MDYRKHALEYIKEGNIQKSSAGGLGLSLAAGGALLTARLLKGVGKASLLVPIGAGLGLAGLNRWLTKPTEADYELLREKELEETYRRLAHQSEQESKLRKQKKEV